MKYLVYGAGTIGTVYAYLLSRVHEVDILVKQEQVERISGGVDLTLKDLKKKSDIHEKKVFCPNCVTKIEKQYDGILVAVNRYQLRDVLPVLAIKQQNTGYFAFMQNNWDIRSEIEQYIASDKYMIAFPSSVGGGRDDKGIEAILFDEPTRLGGPCSFGIHDLQQALAQAKMNAYVDENIFDWLKVHYLQQSITAGAVLENGSFEAFAHSYGAVKKMVKAFREGIEVCRRQGVNTKKTFPANLFKLPTIIVAHTMQKMFLEQNTMEMVNNHMKKGLTEWITGYREVLADGLKNGLSMTVWKSYDTAIEEYLKLK
ncbi:MAG: 2-dehydropantoate 2-reductase N-terminal domain-containing protein [Lachnospiraceae bacterium]|nr:2-dehydropantoate 2-reductase N-terminal domain-containing protein [Lachnospiraceae bacterium]